METSIERHAARPGRRRTLRVLGVMAAVLATQAIWAIADPLLGIHLRAPGSNSSQPWDIGPATVAGATLLLSLAGWALLAVLERMSARGRTIWIAAAVVAAIASLVLPLTGTGVTTANRAVLVSMHLIAAAALIPCLYLSSARMELR